MGQRIVIQYSIDMDELENEVDRLLSCAVEKIDTAHATAHETDKELMSVFTMERIDNLRKQLAAIDHTLRDVSEIINSYVVHRTQESLNIHPVIDSTMTEELLKSQQNYEVTS